MQRPVDAVTSAVLKLQMAQNAVNLFLEKEVIERVSAEPFAEFGVPDFSDRLSKLRGDVDAAIAELAAALARLGKVDEHGTSV